MRTYDILNAGPKNRFMVNGKIVSNSAHGFQPHNLPRPAKAVEKSYERALELVIAGDYRTIKSEFPSVMDVVGSCLRSAIEAPPGYHFDVADLGSIEPRVTAWVSGCQTLMNVFRHNRDAYLDFGSRFYKKPYEEVTHPERQISKPAVLGCCYQLSGGEEIENKDGDIIRTGLWGYAQNMGVEMTREEAHRAVKFYRSEYSEVVECWYNMERAAIAAIMSRQPQTVGPVTFQAYSDKLLCVWLPSGRALHYIRPQIEEQEYTSYRGEQKTRYKISYEGVDSTTKQWTRMDTFGGHFFENIVQAIARDILAHGMRAAKDLGFVIVGHIHDELIALTRNSSNLTLDDLIDCMVSLIKWAMGLPLTAAGYQDTHYRKD